MGNVQRNICPKPLKNLMNSAIYEVL